jgi:F-type H+-transporting ATPase subunit epsilon
MIHLELISLEGKKYDAEVHEVLLPTPDGQIAIFKNHAPLISLVAEGMIGVRQRENHPDDMVEYFATTGGVVEITESAVHMLVDEAAGSDELDEQQAQNALERAKQLRNEAKDQVSLEHAQQMVNRSATQLKVAGLKRRRRQTK